MAQGSKDTRNPSIEPNENGRRFGSIHYRGSTVVCPYAAGDRGRSGGSDAEVTTKTIVSN